MSEEAARVRPPEVTEAEWAIMKVVWEQQPVAAGAVQEALAASWAGPTARSKPRWTGWSARDCWRSRGFATCSSSPRRSIGAGRRLEFRRMLSRAFDGALGPMMQYVVESEQLSQESWTNCAKPWTRPEARLGPVPEETMNTLIPMLNETGARFVAHAWAMLVQAGILIVLLMIADHLCVVTCGHRCGTGCGCWC